MDFIAITFSPAIGDITVEFCGSFGVLLWKPENGNDANAIAFMDTIDGRDGAEWLYRKLLAKFFTL